MDEMFVIGLFWGAIIAFILAGSFSHLKSVKANRERRELDREARLAHLERTLLNTSYVTKDEFRELQLEVKRNAEGW